MTKINKYDFVAHNRKDAYNIKRVEKESCYSTKFECDESVQ